LSSQFPVDSLGGSSGSIQDISLRSPASRLAREHFVGLTRSSQLLVGIHSGLMIHLFLRSLVLCCQQRSHGENERKACEGSNYESLGASLVGNE
jgi:hypothetical protein